MKRDKANRVPCKFYKRKTNGCRESGPRGFQGCHCNGYYINSRGLVSCTIGKSVPITTAIKEKIKQKLGMK